MCSRFMNATPLFLVLLKLCVHTSDTATVEDLTFICSLTDGLTAVNEMPEQCTTLAENTIDFSVIHSAYILKGSLPFMIILGDANYNNKDSFKTTLADLQKDHKFDFVALDMNKILKSNESSKHPDSNQYVIDYVNAIKPDVAGAVFGLIIHNDLQLLKDHNIDFSRINSISTFYIIDTKCIIHCDPPEQNNGPSHLDPPDLTRDVFPAISGLSDMGLALSQLIITIDLQQESFIMPDQGESPSQECSNLNDHNFVTKHCHEPLICLASHASICFEKQLMGVFVEGIEYDDVTGICGCTTSGDPDPTFRCLKTIQSASQGPGPFVPCDKKP